MTTAPDYIPFTWRSHTIYHGDGVLRIGTDAILLGTWLGKVVTQVEHILDVGCGTGILSIMAAAQFPGAKVTAIDNDENAVALTLQNAAHNQIGDRITGVVGDIHTEITLVKKANVIVCNPPFYHEQLPAERKDMLQAKHTGSTSVKWMQSIGKWLAVNGQVVLVLPFDISGKWIAAANEVGLYSNARLNVYSFESDAQPVRSLLQLSRTLQTPCVNSLVLYDRDRQPAAGYTRCLK